MNFLNITDTFKKVAKQYKQDAAIAYKYIEENALYTRLQESGLNVDARDFLPLVTMMGIEGTTREERTADIHKKIDVLTAAFSDQDHSKRTPYLNMIYDLADKADPVTVNMNSEKEVGQLLQCLLMDQSVPVKRIENPEYYSSRYPTKEASVVLEAKCQFLTAASAYINKNLFKVGLPLASLATLPKVDINAPDSVLRARVNFARHERDQVIAANGCDILSDIRELPISDEMMSFVDKSVADTPAYSREDTDYLDFFFSYVIAENLLNSEKKNMLGYKESNFTSFTDPVYIDGIPYVDFLKKHLPGESKCDPVDSRVICTALLNGRHKVDVVQAYRDDNGVMQYEAKTMKVAFTPEQQEKKRQADQQYLKQFSWFRRTFFNWGPFRILPKPEKPNDPRAAKRHDNICKHLKAKIESRIAELQEKARQDKLDDELKEKRRTRLMREKQRFDESVELWDKESVIGILGQQVKGSYDVICYGLHSAAEKDRYNTVVKTLAKQVLYSQLMLERAESNGGPIGPIEATLKGDGRKETIESNITDAVNKISQEEILKDLFYSKVFYNGLLSRTQFEEMIISGGCQHFTLEYLKIQNENQKNKQTRSAENEITMQKQDVTVNIVK